MRDHLGAWSGGRDDGSHRRGFRRWPGGPGWRRPGQGLRWRWQVLTGYNVAMLFMVIEHYRHGPEPVYQRAAEQGRMLPHGLRYIDSWIVDDGRLDRCFQLMETSNPELLDLWRDRWADLCDFEIIPVIKSDEAARRAGHAAPPAAGC
jgi:Domain of unknown function (DUF3303)